MHNHETTVSLPRVRFAFDSFVRASRFVSVTPGLRTSLVALLVAISYYAGSQIGFLYTPSQTPISMFWPANAILLAAFLLAPLRIWWILILALLPVHFLVQLKAGIPALSVFGWFLGNVGEALLGAACIRNFQKGNKPLFHSVQGVLTFLVFGVLLAPLLTSFLDAGFTVVTGLGKGYWILWVDRLTSNMIANLTVVPTIVTFVTGGMSKIWKVSRTQLFEAALLFAATLVISFLVFGRGNLFNFGPALICAPLPLLVWAAVRFGPAGLTCTMLEVTMISIWCALQNIGIFEHSSMPERVISVRILLGLLTLPLMLMTAAIAERRHDEEALEKMRNILISEQESECHRIARQLHTDIAGQLTLASISANEARTEIQAFEQTLLDKLSDQISGALEATLHLSGKIHPFRVEYLGLARGLVDLCHETSVEAQMIIKPSIEDVPSNIPLDLSLRIFRVAQLALQDVTERQAKTATVEFKVSDGQIRLRLADDGMRKGPGRGEGLCLAHIRALLLSLGGTLTLLPSPTGGTVIEASIPITLDPYEVLPRASRAF
jgi:integral membrane sensor domain MASE1